eukprot:6489284-Amphidinium_carterae.3
MRTSILELVPVPECMQPWQRGAGVRCSKVVLELASAAFKIEGKCLESVHMSVKDCGKAHHGLWSQMIAKLEAALEFGMASMQR